MEKIQRDKMSAFCEELMEKTGTMEHIACENDCAIVICSDGDSCATRFQGSPYYCSCAIKKIMEEDAVFTEVVLQAVVKYTHSRIVHAPEPPADGVTEVPLKPVVKDGTETN